MVYVKWGRAGDRGVEADGMAVVIMFGLGFATLLTLVFVPVLYSLVFKIQK